MKLFLATGEALCLTELVGRDAIVEWQDPAQAWEGKKGDLPSTKRCQSRGRLIGVKDGPAGPELAVAQEDDEEGNWGKAMAIPVSLITKVVRLMPSDEYFPTRSLPAHAPDCPVSLGGARHGCMCGVSGPRSVE